MVLAFNGISKQAYSHGFIPKNELISFCFLPPPLKKILNLFNQKENQSLLHSHLRGVNLFLFKRFNNINQNRRRIV